MTLAFTETVGCYCSWLSPEKRWLSMVSESMQTVKSHPPGCSRCLQICLHLLQGSLLITHTTLRCCPVGMCLYCFSLAGAELDLQMFKFRLQILPATTKHCCFLLQDPKQRTKQSCPMHKNWARSPVLADCVASRILQNPSSCAIMTTAMSTGCSDVDM